MHSPYLRYLRKIADGSHHASVMKQNLCHLLHSASLCTTLSYGRYRSSWPGHEATYISKLIAVYRVCGGSLHANNYNLLHGEAIR